MSRVEANGYGPSAAALRAPRRLTSGWLWSARALWWLAVLGSTALFFAAAPGLFTVSPTDEFLKDAGVQANLRAAGLSPWSYNAVQAGFRVVGALIGLAVALVIFWARSDEPMALLVSFLIVGFAMDIGTEFLEALPLFWRVPATAMRFATFFTLPAFFYLFPDGRWTPRWTRWFWLLWVALQLLMAFGPQRSDAPAILEFVFPVLLLTLVGSFPFAQVYRYRRVSDQMQRQQTKWVLFGVALAFVPGLGAGLLSLIVPDFVAPGSLAYVVGQVVSLLGLQIIPISIAIAVLRYRLWDVDPLINRALVYALLTGTLVLIYVGSVILLQRVIGALSGDRQGELVTVVSTLVVAALFQPLRRRIQLWIDRRFYRRKYDAAKTLAAFNMRLREETDLQRLTADLLGVVEQTVQPAHVSLWLREPTSSSTTR